MIWIACIYDRIRGSNQIYNCRDKAEAGESYRSEYGGGINVT